MKCLLQNGTFLAAISSRISHATAELIEQAFCVFDWQAAPEFSFDGRSHIQFQLLWSLPARQTRVQVGLRTRAAAGVILSLLSQEQNEYLRLEVSHSCALPPLWLTCCGPKKWWLAPQTMIAVNAGRQRVNNIRVGDIWVDTEGGGDWHMYVLVKVFQQVCRKLLLRGSYLKN